ncbi:putative sigma-24 [Magnetofaba australis IT-1]|uniref:Putative sigma-24 n=2 Tax=Magnetofaba TaxID=1472292 RepID=A0A1Y2K6W2_9PROT|nr:putative sigma-24 [Magnetofaba australis IT-1]
MQMISLHTPVAQDDGHAVELGDTLSTDQGLWADHGMPWHERAEWRVDLQRELSQLPATLQATAAAVSVASITEVAAARKVSRALIHKELSQIGQRLRKVF